MNPPPRRPPGLHPHHPASPPPRLLATSPPHHPVLASCSAPGRLQAVANAGELSGLGSTIVGTFGYMAPEQFRGAADTASDLYGLGATLLYLLSGGSAAGGGGGVAGFWAPT